MNSLPAARPSRRQLLRGALAGGVAGALGAACVTAPAADAPSPIPGGVVRDGALKQSLAGWCFLNQGPQWDVATLARRAADLGCRAVELVDPEHWETLRAHGLVCAATKSHTFVRGMAQRGHWAECHEALERAIEVTSAAGFPNVMTFTGMADTSTEPNGGVVTPEEGLDNCVEGYRRIVGQAERAGVTLVLEPLNTRDPAPMKGHPGYLGDHVDECVEIVRRVDSPALRLLFDVYHVQVMDGDLVRRIAELRDLIGHVQVAGCPGRGPLTPDQEIHYPAVARALADSGYAGYVGHEWIAREASELGVEQQLAASVAALVV